MSGPQTFLQGRVVLHAGDSREVLKGFADNSIDAVVTDAPYGLGKEPDALAMLRAWIETGHLSIKGKGFMGREWDAFVPQPDLWREVFRVLKPGGHAAVFFGTRTYDVGALALRLAGFEIRDQLAWVYGSGFPKSLDVSKAIDKAKGCERAKVRIPVAAVGNLKARQDSRPFIEAAMERGYHEAVSDEAVSDEAVSDEAVFWQGWGTALKPAWEPICLARKPIVGTVAANVLAHGTGGLNIDAARVGDSGGSATVVGNGSGLAVHSYGDGLGARGGRIERPDGLGRFPANIVHDGSPEVLAGFPESDVGSGSGSGSGGIWSGSSGKPAGPTYGDGGGSAARFFYSAKADSEDRAGSKHPTVKPVDLMQWLCRLMVPPGGTLLDPFAGTGTTGAAAWREGFNAVLIEREAEFRADVARRMALEMAGPQERKREILKARGQADYEIGGLFGRPA